MIVFLVLSASLVAALGLVVLGRRASRGAGAPPPPPPRQERGPLPEGGGGLATFYAIQLAAGRIEPGP